MKTSVQLMLAVGASTIALAAPSVAGAKTFCVHAPNCPADGVDTQNNLQNALKGAFDNPGADTVLVGDKGLPYEGPFNYGKAAPGLVPAGAVGPNPVAIERDGAARPVLSANGGDTVLALAGGTLKGIDVEQFSSGDGIGIVINSGTLEDVRVTAPIGGLGTGVQTDAGVRLIDLQITGYGDMALDVGAGAPSDVIASDVTIADTPLGVRVAPGSKLRLAGSHVAGQVIGIHAGAGSSLSLRSSAVTTDGIGSDGLLAESASVSLDHTTFAYVGPPDPTAIGLDLAATEASARANLSSVVLAGYAHAFRRVSDSRVVEYTVTAQDSVWNDAGDKVEGGEGTPVIEKNDVHVEPALVDRRGGDLRPRASSAQIDRDQATEADYTDAAGEGTVDGDGDGSALADAGAFEYLRQAPRIDAAAGGAAGAFTALVSDPDADAVQVKWQFDDGATAAGADATHTFATPGSHTATVVAVDETGLQTTRAVTVDVPAPAGPAAPGTPAKPGAPAGPALDGIAPKLGSVSLSSKKATLRKARGLKLRFRVSEAVTLRIESRRLVNGRVVGARATIVKKVAAGKGSIKLAGVLKRAGLLKRGRLSFAVTATDAAGNTSARKLTKLVLR